MTDLPAHIHWLQLSFVDVLGTVNSVLLPASRYDEALERGVLFDGSALEGRARLYESDMRLRPVPDTLIDLGDGVARIVCSILGAGGEPWPGDPRGFLADAVAASGDLGDSLRLAAELEFYLLDELGEPIDQGGYFDEVVPPGSIVLRRAAQTLRDRGVEVRSAHHEAGPGQYEIDLGPRDPLAFADAIVLAKQTIRETAREHGLRATFMPLAFDDRPGSGLHVHQSADELFAGSGLSEIGRQFVAGQLHHARALSALTSPTTNSYRRLQTGPEAPSAAIWGHLSRAALIRVSPPGGLERSIEFRGSDPSANPYLVAAGLLVAGVFGIDDELELAPPSDEAAGAFDPADSQRFQPLPRNLDEALDALAADDRFVDALDPLLLDRLIDGRRAEAEYFRGHVTEQERSLYGEQG